MAEIKTQLTKASVTKFLNTIKDKQKREDCFAISKMMEKASKAKPELWGELEKGSPQNFVGGRAIVGFGRRTYTYSNGKVAEWMKIGFAPRKSGIALYGLIVFKMSGGGLKKGKDENNFLLKLGKYKESGSCLHIKKLSDVNTKELEKIIILGVKRNK